MTPTEYQRRLDAAIPHAEAWADLQLNIQRDGRTKSRGKWERHFGFFMDEVRRSLGGGCSYDVLPELLRLPHYEKGDRCCYDMARDVLAARTPDAVQGLAEVKRTLGQNGWDELRAAAAYYLSTFDLTGFLDGYRARLHQFMNQEAAA